MTGRPDLAFRLIVILPIFVLLLFVRLCAEPGWLKDAMESAETVEIDKDAPAFVIYDFGETKISSNGKSTTHVRYAVKIINALGTKYGILHEITHPSLEINRLKGWLIKPNGEKQSLRKEDIVRIDLESTAGYYHDRRSLVAEFPDVGAGDVVAYEYDIKESEYWCSYGQHFIFQIDLPVLLSQYVVELPKGWVLNESSRNIESVERSVEKDRYEWKSGFLPYRPDEPYMPDWIREARILSISCYDSTEDDSRLFGDWDATAEWIRTIFSKATISDSSIQNVLSRLELNSPTTEQLIRAIAKYVRDEIRYVAVEIGEGRFTPRKAPLTLSNRYGDCKDKATLMIAILRAAGIQASPVLAAVGDTVFSNFPSPFQFNHAIVAIRLDSSLALQPFPQATVGDWLYYDPTNPAISVGELPVVLYGSRVLRISEADYELVTLPAISPDQYLRVYRADAILGEDNSLSASVTITDYGRRASNSMYQIRTKSTQNQVKQIQKLFTNSVQNPRISDYHSGSAGDSCWMSFLLEGDNYTSTAGDLTMLKVNFFSGDNPVENSRKKRQHPFSFNKIGLYKTEIDWRLPKGLEFEGELATVEAECKIANLESHSTIADSVLSFSSIIEYIKGSIPSTEYRDAYRFLKKQRACDNLTAIVVKR